MSVSEVDPSELVVNKAWDTSLFRRLLEFIRPHRRLFLASFSVLMCLFAGELFGTWIWRGAIDGPVAGAAGAAGFSPRRWAATSASRYRTLPAVLSLSRRQRSGSGVAGLARSCSR